ncbi:hypothetical protein GGR51DRAFT_508560 [Nemania sp. FL0031]|nr:hypothetical protein GGR51DRAFT_508560 [Nemania sp. FL0031]
MLSTFGSAPSSFRLSPEEDDPEVAAYKAANEAWAARQRELYLIPGVDLTPEERHHWNGRSLLRPASASTTPSTSAPSSLSRVISSSGEVIARTRRCLASLWVALGASIAQLRIAYGMRKMQFSKWRSQVNDDCVERRDILFIWIPEIVAWIRLFLFIVIAVYALVGLVLRGYKMATRTFEDGMLKGNVTYQLVEEHRSWSVATQTC